MDWTDIQGHDRIRQMFATALEKNRLASTFLFVGPASIGKRKFALMLGKTLLCQNVPAYHMRPCGNCEDCKQVDALTHPDLLTVSRPKDKTRIPVELLIGDGQHRMESGLCHDIAMRPFRGQRKVAILDDADDLNQEGANCLLKTLEEPPADSVIILISQSEQRQLPTIRSRCQILRFAPLPDEIVSKLLLELSWVADQAEADKLARQSKGSLARAEQLRDEGLQGIAEVLLSGLAKHDFHAVQLAKDVADYLQKMGDDAPKKREALSHLMELAADFYRNQLVPLSQAAVQDSSSDPAVRSAVLAIPSGLDGAAACLERCAEAETQLDANANIATLVESWLDDLASAARLGYVESA
ncbi:ATP-binding protein [Blastopirellula marina]|uniref:AAA family ATPase n=1 Tax=Blastopirellula marina TaxID=124 RepID=A0A2S8GRR7_9BACT|nr:AAA family ATPase [Blastopirellula marina]PQO47102.1 AAA family ATPase [Blastopirellula marina]